MYYVKEVSEKSGVSVRTLHHYDSIGLLSPAKDDNSYRIYSQKDLSQLQTILFYRYLGFPLREIKALMSADNQDLLSHLYQQLELMQEEKKRLLTLIETLETTIQQEERGLAMSIDEQFKGFKYHEDPALQEEAKEKYGKEVVEDSQKKIAGKEEELMEGFNRIFFAAADNMRQGMAPDAEENINLAEQLHQHIRGNSFDCTLEIFSGIGELYVTDVRFQDNIDQFAPGLAVYINDAIQAYVSQAEG